LKVNDLSLVFVYLVLRNKFKSGGHDLICLGVVKMINKGKIRVLPLLPLRGLTVFPYMTLPFDVGRKKSIKALEEAMVKNQLILLVTQKDAKIDEPGTEDIYSVGTISKVKQLLKLPGDTIRVLVEGISRAKVSSVLQMEPFFLVEAEEIVESADKYIGRKAELEALKRLVIKAFEEYAKLSGKISADTAFSIVSVEDADKIADIITANMALRTEQKQEILEEFNVFARLEKLLKILNEEVEILGIERNISAKVRKQIEKSQREYYLREQLKAIQNELEGKDGESSEIDAYRQKLEEANLPEEAREKVLKELDRLSKLPPGSAEVGVIRTYLDWIFDLPWNKRTEDIIDLDRAEKILNEDHYGLEKVKERILEYLAVSKMKNNLKGPILCLVGPPGVGKTSIARSVARALNRNYVRMSLGGVRDEAEIRGHRRTYVGSMPGRIIAAMKQAGSMNPLILMDEIDKMSSDFRGDPASAMLEVLDSEQNFAFRDHYLEIPFDLSDVLFFTTANSTDTIPRPLLDRMEVINISGYTEEEKYEIARRHLIPKQLKAHGLKKSSVVFDNKAIHDIINYYTREAGVRNLEREIANICRKAAKMLVASNKKSIKINSKRVEEFLGTRRFRFDMAAKTDEVGVATGLAWTAVGGETLSVEVSVMEGSGKLELTGQLGDVMKESAKTAFSFVRSRAREFDIDPDFYKKYDIHIHVPEGAIPKDGPSAGITLATAMVSALSGNPVRKDVAMTGEITLRGRVLPIGGLKEKALAAHRAGIYNIIVPLENKKDVDEIPKSIKDRLKFIFVASADDVIKTAIISKEKKEKDVHKKEDEDSSLLLEEKIQPGDIAARTGIEQ